MKKLLMMVLLGLTSLAAWAQTEDCSNGIDDDGDGLVDCLDPDCSGGPVPTGTQFNTANNGLGGVLPGGVNDSHWTVSTGSMAGPYVPATVMSFTPGSYYSSPWPDCDWISHNATGSHSGNVDYYYKIQFYLPCVNGCGTSYADPGTFCLYMDFFCDNSVDAVYINGTLQTGLPGVPAADPYFNVGFNASGMISLALCNNWQPGLNELIIKVSSGGPYAGFLAQNSTTAPAVSGDPTISLPAGSTASYCTSAPPVSLTAASPGGTWSASCGTCIDSVTGVFDPAAAGAGSHLVSYHLSAPCPAQDTIVIDVSVPGDPTIVSPTLTLCTNGSPVTLSAGTGGTWSATCGSCIDPATGEFDPSTGAGTYVVTYSIAACSVSDTSLVQVVAAGNATINTPAAPLSVCMNNGKVPLTALFPGGTWSGSCGACVDPLGLFSPADAGPGTFTVYYTVGGACPDVDSVTITVVANPDAGILPVSPLCTEDAPITLSGVTPGGTWSGPGITGPSSGTFDPALAGTGHHTVYYSFGGLCPDTDSIVIVVNSLSITGSSTDVTCNGFSDGSISISATGFGLPTFTITGPLTQTNTTGSFSSLPAGTYTIQASSSAGCTASGTATISSPAPVVAAFTADPVSGYPPLEVTFTNTSANATGYTWVLGNGSTTTTTDAFTIYAEGVYNVMLIATNGPCADTAYLLVTAELPSFITIPNIFTPNGDGVNDLLVPGYQNITLFDFKIFNRWGQLMFESDDITRHWDGKNSGNADCTDGTYFYLLKAGGGDGKSYEQRGTVTLTRQ